MIWVDVIWGAVLLVFLSFETWTILNKEPGDTFSERTRHYFRVKGKTGAFIFLAVWGMFGAWFAAHIVQITV